MPQPDTTLSTPDRLAEGLKPQVALFRPMASDAASYISEMCSGMITIAQSANLEFLVYLLAQVRLEADLMIHQTPEPAD